MQISLLRGVCQIPAYVAHARGYFRDEGLEVEIQIDPTAWVAPARLEAGETQFALIPWTRVAMARDSRLLVVAGSGHEEAAIVVRKGISLDQVRRVAIPRRGGMKDLTAMALIERLGWGDRELIRQPSGDGAIISFFGEGADAASMIEPYATMLVQLGLAEIVMRTGDLWPGAPGCSLATSRRFRDQHPDQVLRFVRAFARGVRFVGEDPDQAAALAFPYIGIHQRFIRAALDVNRPNVDAVRNREALDNILQLMRKLGYLEAIPSEILDLSFLDSVAAEIGA